MWKRTSPWPTKSNTAVPRVITHMGYKRLSNAFLFIERHIPAQKIVISK